MNDNDPQLYLYDMLVNASYHGYQDFILFTGGDLKHFQENLQIV